MKRVRLAIVFSAIRRLLRWGCAGIVRRWAAPRKGRVSDWGGGCRPALIAPFGDVVYEGVERLALAGGGEDG